MKRFTVATSHGRYLSTWAATLPAAERRIQADLDRDNKGEVVEPGSGMERYLRASR